MMDRIHWEQTADGKTAHLADGRPFHLRSAVALRRLAVAKMEEVSLISAEFGGRPLVFEPAVEVLIDAGARVDFMALYVSALPLEDDSADLPTVCARRCVWTRDDDFDRLNHAASKLDYLTRGPQVTARIVFPTSAEGATLSGLTDEAASLFRRGVPVESVERSDAGWHELMCRVAHGSAHFTFSYTPFVLKSEELEEWVRKWADGFASLDFAGGLVPDDGCRISYTHSLLERLASISE